MSDNMTGKEVATADQADGAAAQPTRDRFHSYKEVRDACRDFADRANKIEHRANKATRDVKPLMLHQVQLARTTNEVLATIHRLAEHYKRMDESATELLLPHNYILDDRMVNADVSETHLFLTEELLKDAHSGLKKAEKLVDAHEEMEDHRDQIHEAVANIQQLAAAASKLARELDEFVPRAAIFFHNLGCGCDVDEGCFAHDWEPKSKTDRNIRNLDERTADILANLDGLLQRLASDIGKRPASPRGDKDGPDPLAGVYQGNLDSCVIGGCCICGSDDHATAACPKTPGATSSREPEGGGDNFYMMSGALQTEDEDETMTSDAL